MSDARQEPRRPAHGVLLLDSSSLRSIPARPGCYLFKDAEGTVLYVGKASSLRSRVRSYFGKPAQQSAKVRVMLSHAVDIDTIVTDSEIEALILENNLIKEKHPRYNVALRDDKQYPYICVTLQEPYPRVIKVRRTRKDGGLYFGPYADGGALNETLSILKKLFPYRSCDIAIPDEADHPEPVLARPCLEFFIKRCDAPCMRYIDRPAYLRIIDQVILFLEGKHQDVLRGLREQMDGAAKALDFEKAALLRDQVSAVERMVERQKITVVNAADQDILALAQDDSEACVQVFHVREGKVIGQTHYFLDAEASEPSEMLQAFIQQFYERSTHVPRELLVQYPVETDLLEQWLAGLRDGAVRVTVPRIGMKRKLVEMVSDNAREKLEQQKLRWLNDAQKTTAAISELQEALGLETAPHRIECFDISNIQGTSPVGSMVVFEGGKHRNSQYRRFKIKTVEGANDFA
ncbi:MAG: excinuclease ABC subunit UvrC, partial [Chloroflexota bacterium]